MNQETDSEVDESILEFSLDSCEISVSQCEEGGISSQEDDSFSTASMKEDERDVYLLNLEYSNERFYAFAPDGLLLKKGDFVVVPTKYGVDIAKVCSGEMQPTKFSPSDKVTILRLAEEDDFNKYAEAKHLESEAGKVFKEKVTKHNLSMKFIACHYLILEAKMLFFFSSDSRVDFRLLVRDLVSIFKMRVELRQIGVRDETRFIGGMAPCGRSFCCNSITDKMEPVSIKMAKDEGLSLNSNRISGHCGRLLCCLAYEHKHYVELNKMLPGQGCRVLYDEDIFKVREINKTTMMVSLINDADVVVNVPVSRLKKMGSTWKVI